jgi:transposase
MDQLPALDKLSGSEKDVLIQVLWAEVQALKARIAQLEAQLQAPKKGSHNSSVPPSKSPKASKPEAKSGRGRRKASLGRAGGGRPLHPDPDQTVIAQVKMCPYCGQEVAVDAQKLHALYDKIEIPPVLPVVTRVRQYGGQCSQCGQLYVAPVPVGLEPGSPYGTSVEKLVTYLRYGHAISYQRLSGLLGQVFGLAISEGALANLLQRVKLRLDDRVAEILGRLRRSRLICSDETGARVKGQNQWEWVFQNDQVCLHVIRPSRGHRVIEEVLGEHRPQVWVSDLYSAQRQHPAVQWQVCLAHQLRDCQFAIEAGDRVFAPVMKRVLLRAFEIHQRQGRLAESTLYQYRCELERRLEYCLALTPTQRDGVRLKKRYLGIRDNLFLFLEDATVPPTNNSSERALRLSTIFRKVTNGFRSDWGRDLFGAVRSVVNTGQRQGLSQFEAIQRALSPAGSLFYPG